MELLKSIIELSLELALLLPPANKSEPPRLPFGLLEFVLMFTVVVQGVAIVGDRQDDEESDRISYLPLIVITVLFVLMVLLVDTLLAMAQSHVPRQRFRPSIVAVACVLPIMVGRFGEGFYMGSLLRRTRFPRLTLLATLSLIVGTAVVLQGASAMLISRVRWLVCLGGAGYAAYGFVARNNDLVHSMYRSVSKDSSVLFNGALGVQIAAATLLASSASGVSVAFVAAFVVGAVCGRCQILKINGE